MASLREIVEIAQKRNLAMHVAVLPHTWNFVDQHAIFEKFERFYKENNITVINLLETFIADKVPEKSLRLNLLDSHPNEKYYALLVDYLAPHVVRIIN